MNIQTIKTKRPTILITKRALKAEPIEGARVLIEPSVKEHVAMWLSNVTIAEAAELLDVSASVIKAIRAHVGVVGRGD